MHVKEAREEDLPRITEIYGREVREGLASFEEVPPGVAEMTARWRSVRDGGLPYLVADCAGLVAGYAYASPYRPRPAYRYTLETSVYLAPEARRQGVGQALMEALLSRCAAGPWRQAVAVIGDSGNAASIRLHEALGFELRGVMQAVGFKHGRWVDTVLMQRALGAGADDLPM